MINQAEYAISINGPQIKISKIKLQTIALWMFYLCLPLVGVVNTTLLSIVFFALVVFLSLYDEGYLLYPGIIVYYSFLYVPFISLSLYRFYALIMLAKIVFTYGKIKIKPQIVQALVLIVYMLFGVMVVNMRLALFGIVDVLFIYFYITAYVEKNKDIVKKVIGALAIACVCSIITGQISGASIDLSYELDDSWRKMSRFIGTFDDPNYCCFMYILSIIGVVSTKPFKKTVNVMLVLALSVGLIMTISFTGYIGILVVLSFYSLLTKSVNVKTFIFVVVILALLFSLYTYGENHKDAPILGDVAYRIDSYIVNYQDNGDDSLAVSRISIYESVIEKYNNQSLFKKIFGMNTEIPQIVRHAFWVAHNDYVDMLYNCGMLLSMVFYIGFFWLFIKSVKKYQKTKNPVDAFLATTKVIWIYYSFSLTMLSERMFYLCLFL